MEVDFGVDKLVGLVRVFKASFDVVLELSLELLLLFMLFDLVMFMLIWRVPKASSHFSLWSSMPIL